MSKVKTHAEVVSFIKDGDILMVGGFLGVGTPEGLIDALVEQGTKEMTLIANDTGFLDKGVGKLVVNRQFKRILASHIGTNPETGRQLNTKETEVICVPQGTLAEQVRAAGAGLGGILTPTGIGTVVEEGKQKITIEGQEYLLELPLKADVALLKADIADEQGNLVYRKSARNFNPLMAMAAKLVIVEVREVVGVGEIDPDHVMTPGIFVDYLVKEGCNCES